MSKVGAILGLVFGLIEGIIMALVVGSMAHCQSIPMAGLGAGLILVFAIILG